MFTTADARALPLTANERFKRGFEVRLALAFLAATLLHFLAFELWPTLDAPTWTTSRSVVDLVSLDPIDLPPAPEPLPRPLAPVPSATVNAEATIPAIPADRRLELPPPPPDPVARSESGAIPFTPFEVAPRIANPEEVRRALERAYPSLLRDAGIEGTVALLVHIDARGNVLEARVGTSSGVKGLDEAALGAVATFRFHPALNRDRPVAVWTRVPVTFEVRR